MKKIFIFMLAICIGLSFTSCESFVRPADAKLIGTGEVKKCDGVCYVEVDNVRYAPHLIQTEMRVDVELIENAKVTAFTRHGSKEIEFIYGDWSEEALEKQFTYDYSIFAIPVIFILSFALGTLICHCVSDWLKKRNA